MSVHSAPEVGRRLSSDEYSNTISDSDNTNNTAVTASTLASPKAYIPLKRPYSDLPFIRDTRDAFELGASEIIDINYDSQKIVENLSDIMIRRSKRYKVQLSLYSLSWEKVSKKKKAISSGHKTSEISLVNVLGACSHFNFSLKRVFRKKTDIFRLRVYTYKRGEGDKWKLCYLQFNCGTLKTAQEWSKNINVRLKLLNRPRRCHVFINPFSGENTASQIYNNKVSNIFQIADISPTITVTNRRGHAYSVVQTLDLNSIDVIVCIGGDGLFGEVYNSLLWRQQKDFHHSEAGLHDPIPCHVKIGLIPAGSTNGVVFCTTGLADPVTSALQIAMGRETSIDVISVWHNNRIERFATNFIGYGFFGDVLKDSEIYRWMGPTRYDFSGFKTILNLGSYKGEIMFKEGITSGQPKDRRICKKGCAICQERQITGERQWVKLSGEFASIEGCIMSCCSPQANKGLSPAAHLGDGCLDLIIHRSVNGLRYFRYLTNVAFFSEPFTGDLVDVYRVTEFKFKATCRDHVPGSCRRCSYWNIDGELYTESEIHVKAHRQILTLLASQPE